MRRVRWKAKQLRLAKAARLGRDVTQEEVSLATGLSIGRISTIENNRTQGLEFSTIERLAEFYGVSSIGDLLDFLPEEASANEEDAGNQKPTRAAA